MGRQGNLNERYSLIDALRGFSLLNMLAFHFLYDVFVIYGDWFEWTQLPWVVVWERYICSSFILISGISLNFSRRAVRRGLIVNACGLLITLVTAVAIPSQIIIFGVLNCIGCAMLLDRPLKKLGEKLNPFLGASVALALFAFFYGLPMRYLGFFGIPLISLPDALYCFRPLAIIGLPDMGFSSADYFPLIPWLFLFVCGFFVWRCIVRLGADRFFKLRVPVLDFLGRYSLWIYMIHQPVLMGICFLIFGRF